MKKYLKVISLLFLLSFLLYFSLSMTVSAETETGDLGGGFTYTIDDEAKTVTITGKGILPTIDHGPLYQIDQQIRTESYTLVFSDGITGLPDKLSNFGGCRNVWFGKDLKEWGEYSLPWAKYTVDPQNPYYASYKGSLYTKDYTKLLKLHENKTGIEFHPNLQIIGEDSISTSVKEKRLVIPWGVTTMEGRNFWRQIEDVVIPDTLTNISLGVRSFYRHYSYLIVSENNRTVAQTLKIEPSLADIQVSYKPTYRLDDNENLFAWNFYDCYGITPNSLKTFQNSKTYYFDKNYKMVKGWNYVGGNWYYFNDYGAAVVKCWKQSGGKWFYMQADGTMAKNKWVEWYKKWYYVGADGAMYANRKTPDGYWVNGSGVWVK